MLFVLRDVQLEDAVDDINDLAVVDNLLVGVVPHTHLDECLQDEVHQFHGLRVDVIEEVLDEGGHFSHNVDVVDVVLLLTQVVLHQPVLPITHQPQHLQGQLDVGRVLEAKQLCSLIINVSIAVDLG